MKQFFIDEDDEKEESATETKPVSAVENSVSNSLLSSGEGTRDGAMQSPGGSLPPELMVYTITSEEILILVKHWFESILDNAFFSFRFGTEVSALRRDSISRRRINYARTVIGEETVDQAIEEVREEFKAKVDPRLWNIFEYGSDEEWREVREEFRREEWGDYCARYLREMERLETKYPNDMIALVLRDWPDHKRKPVLVSATLNPKFAAALRTSGELEVETDKSRIPAIVVDQKFMKEGFLRIRRENGRWIFTDPYTEEDAINGEYFQWNFGPIVSVLKACMEGEQEDDDLSSEI